MKRVWEYERVKSNAMYYSVHTYIYENVDACTVSWYICMYVIPQRWKMLNCILLQLFTISTHIFESLESLKKGKFIICSVFQLVTWNKGNNSG